MQSLIGLSRAAFQNGINTRVLSDSPLTRTALGIVALPRTADTVYGFAIGRFSFPDGELVVPDDDRLNKHLASLGINSVRKFIEADYPSEMQALAAAINAA